jgi:glycosyltransferase involved in cell wall biosynthesis
MRINAAFPSGDLHCELLKSLGFNGSIKITRGVGIINKQPYSEVAREYKKRFLFVGRLSEVKNLAAIILIFNKMPDYTLTIVGDGDELVPLKKISSGNVFFLGKMKNSELKNQYLKNDFFILPSTSETWGLVVEEALYFGCPVLISKNCGSRELIENGVNGFIIDPYDSVQIKSIIESIDRSNYQDLLIGMSKLSIDAKDIEQVNVY